jgi:hypothetical protein
VKNRSEFPRESGTKEFEPAVVDSPAVCGLPGTWRQRALELRQIADAEGPARALECAAKELEEWLAKQSDQLLSVSQAATRVGRHPDTIRKAISKGRLINLGRRRAPRVRAGDLEVVFTKHEVAPPRATTYDPIADARSLVVRRGG